MEKGIKQFIAQINKPHISEFDLFQKILFEVELYCGDKLAKAIGGEEIPKVLSDQEYYWAALDALLATLPEELFREYIQILDSATVKEAMSVYPAWREEFRQRCLALGKRKRIQKVAVN